ncbi:MAG: fibro-slime domain-containing protein [Fibrobacter sp.]|nr:fibro-slime domain-containing protein [Fibrobacter sp.]
MPRMVVGNDTLLMRHHPTCGWFWTGLEGDQRIAPSVHFIHPHANLSIPATGSVDLTSILTTQDSVFVDAASATAAAEIGTPGECFDGNRVVNVLHPWQNNEERSELPIYARAGNLTGNQKVMTALENYWYSYEFTEANTKDQQWGNDYAKFEVHSYYTRPESGKLVFPHSFLLTDLFPEHEYEVWLVPYGREFKILRAEPNPTVINLYTPWETNVPAGIIDGDTIPMPQVKGLCGWYSLVLWEEPDLWNVNFKQSLGFEVYTQNGLEEGPAFDLNDEIEVGDTLWLMPNPYPSGNPEITKSFPDVFGECPTRTLAVMLMDWADTDKDFGGVYNGDGKHGTKCPNLQLNMVEEFLGPNGLPVKSDKIDSSCTASENIEGWFIPQEIQDSYTNAVCYDLPLEFDHEGFWLADIAENQEKGIDGFFPLDDFIWLDEAQTIRNPKHQIERESPHNFLFTMVVDAQFSYHPGQYFEFRGDDDVWVFINNRLVVDLGGVHGPEEGAVDLDTLGLTIGDEYSFKIFFVERNCCGANFKMRTSIDLRTERSFFGLQVQAEPGVDSYEIWQILKEEAMSCDFSNTSGKADTIRAPAIFTLTGAQFGQESVRLKAGENYGGIFITSKFDGINIDTAAIVRNRALAPGPYVITATHASDPSLTFRINFTVPTYPLPSITFTDSLGVEIDPDTVELGEWSFVPYPVYIQAHYMGVPCDDCSDELSLTSPDSLQFVDENKKNINKISLDSGRAVFWVVGEAVIKNGSFTVKSKSVQNELIWRNINLKEPPVPFLRYANIFDRDGDGYADSLILVYSRPLKGKDLPDSLEWQWGTNPVQKVGHKEISTYIKADTSIIIADPKLLPELFTGDKNGESYFGNSITYFTFIDDDKESGAEIVPFEIAGSIADSVGPVALNAEISLGKSMDTLFVDLSESMELDSIDLDNLFEFIAWRDGENVGANVKPFVSIEKAQGSKWLLMFSTSQNYTVTMGDSLRLNPNLNTDLSSNFAHKDNPWVRIVGRQRTSIDVVGVVDLNPETAPKENSPVVSEVLVGTDSKIEDVIKEQGVPGHLIRYDLSNLYELYGEDLDPDDMVVEYETYYYTNLGAYVNNNKTKIKCTDKIFDGHCGNTSGYMFLGWNMRSADGRLVGTGPYVVKLNMRIKIKDVVVERIKNVQSWGIRRK